MQKDPNSNNDRFSIGNAARFLKVSIDTLRRWEKAGKITSYRSPGGHRYFFKNDLTGVFGARYKRTKNYKIDFPALPKTNHIDQRSNKINEAITESILLPNNLQENIRAPDELETQVQEFKTIDPATDNNQNSITQAQEFLNNYEKRKKSSIKNLALLLLIFFVSVDLVLVVIFLISSV